MQPPWAPIDFYPRDDAIASVDFDIQIAHSVRDVDQAAWDALGQGRPFASSRWYRYGEAVLSSSTPLYIIFSQAGQALGRATFWLKRQEALPTPSRLMRGILGAVLQRWPLLIVPVVAGRPGRADPARAAHA